MMEQVTPPRSLRHQALLYSSLPQFLEAAVPFVRDGVQADDHVMVVVDPEKGERLRAALGPIARHVTFADADDVYTFPAWTLASYCQEVRERTTAGAGMRVLGEPIWAGRSAAEVEGWACTESVLNDILADAPVEMMCPYDVSALHAGVTADAHLTHPDVTVEGHRRPSPRYTAPVAFCRRHDGSPLPPPTAPAEGMAFGPGDLLQVREFVTRYVRAAGLSPRRVSDVVLAVHEAVANSLRHGGGGGTVRLWVHDGRLLCDVSDRGRMAEPLLGLVPPDPESDGGRGLWLMRQLCELVEMRSTASGLTVRLHVFLA